VGLSYFLNLPVADAGCADPHAPGGAIYQGANRLQVQIPAAIGHIVGVADPVSELRSAAANFTNSCHKTEISRSFRKQYYSNAEDFPATRLLLARGVQQPSSRRRNLQTGGSAGTVLVVEDVEAVRKLVCSLLAQGGYDCLAAADGVEALNLVERRIQELNLVLTDVDMPHMNGSELARRLGRLRPDLPILFMSGYLDDPAVESVGKSGLPLLSKPFTSDALMQAVQDAMTSPRSPLPKPYFGNDRL
jgi:CheY-like chemotaxis protein